MSTITEPLHWHDAEAEKPEAMKTVLLWLTDPEYPFTNGYWDGQGWIDDGSGGDLVGVTHWAIPRGPHA